MKSLLAALLEYSRLTTRAEPFVEVEFMQIVRDVLSDLEARIEREGGVVQVEDLPVAQGDPTQMRQLFQNLIGNALKFHKRGEKPIVRVFCTPADNTGCRIVIEDGIGFDQEFAGKIFAPFQRLHGKSSQYEGTGMGLALCEKIVERQGGGITVECTPGIGSSFIIEFSMKSREPANR
ncbi:MAG: ATP-binding protein [Syntrophobacteraceae bacterium]